MGQIGVELHGVTLNVACNYEPLLDYLSQLLDDAVRPVFDAPDLDVNGTWRTEPFVEDESAFADEGETAVPGFGKRMRLADEELVWFNTHRDKDLQLRFRKRGDRTAFDVVYAYCPTAEKLARYPAYAERKFFKLARYLVQFPVAWYLERTRGWTLLHASAVARGGEAVLVAGPGGAGKTTTCIGLLAYPGVRLVTENLLFTDGEHIFPLREPIRLTEDSLALLTGGQGHALVPLGLGGASKHKSLFRLPHGEDAHPVRAAALFIPRFTTRGSLAAINPGTASELLGATNRLTLELNDYDWYTAALDLLWPAAGHAGHQARVLARLTAQTPCYALGIDRTMGVAPVVDRVLSCVGWTQASAPRPVPANPIDLPAVNGARPIRCFTGEALLPDEAARNQLSELAAVDGVDGYVAVLPDVHFKRRNPTPTGTVVVSRTHLVPRAIDPGINCGMRMIATAVPARELSPSRLDRLFTDLIAAIPITARDRPVLTADECERLLVDGLPAVAAPLGLPPEDLARIENGGRMTPAVDPAAIQAAVTPAAVSKGQAWLGTLGAGNHFLELQEIVSVLDTAVAGRLGLRLGDGVFMMHTDSRRLGKRVLKAIFEEAFQARGNGHGPDSLWTIPAESAIGQRYIAALAAAMHAGFANRAMLTHILRTTVRAVLDDPTLPLPLLYDCAHESIQREEHGGQTLWVHRHGASHAVPPAALAHDPVLRETGQPVPIPGSMGTDSYIAVTADGVDATFHSVAHGAGRTLEKIDAAVQFDADQVTRDLGADGIRLYRYGTDNIAGQAPASFKDVRRVVEAMTAFQLIRPVARLRPVAVLKG
jgi:tRNA-splicing ligase RtcB